MIMNFERQYIALKNNAPSEALKNIPVLSYEVFRERIISCLQDENKHCVSYYGVKTDDNNLRLICCFADDSDNSIQIFSAIIGKDISSLDSAAVESPQVHIFEREIHENSGIMFRGHPWLKPVRFAHNRADTLKTIDNYPFYFIHSEELHEVGVGPVHAGVIEPGHFRFICNGEKVHHLEIQLGYQHRGLEELFISKQDALQSCILSESIAGDTSMGHSLAHSQLIESLSGMEVSEGLQIERCIALELERIAVHIGDTAALCGDIAYQLGQVVCEALRTMVINTTQLWCGNRFGKGLIRPGGSNYPLNSEISDAIVDLTTAISKRFGEVTDCIYLTPGVLTRFDEIGVVTKKQAHMIGAVGPSARTCGIMRDTRKSHPFQYFKKYNIEPVILDSGDVLARGMIRNLEVHESLKIIRDLLKTWSLEKGKIEKPVYSYKLKPENFSVSIVEGWRGEICHSAVTDKDGKICHYKIKDPSFHNWMALALAVRNQEISDFPVCNKSFNLSYCGHDL
jgi:Ni,Fe-hydrogenase III large subunit